MFINTKCLNSHLQKLPEMPKLKLFEWDQNDEEEIYKNLGRTKNMVNEDIKIIQTWMKTQPHLPEIMDENSIRNMLVLSKGSIEKTKRKIDGHYTLLRIHLPEIFENSHPELPHMKQIFDLCYVVLLPKLNKDKSRVYITKIRDKKRQSEIKTENLIMHGVNFAEICFKESFQMNVTIIIDLIDLTADGVKNTNLVLCQKVYKILQKCYGGSYIKTVYLVNVPPIATATIAVFKNFLKEKYVKKMHFCKNTAELLDMFPKEILPKDYGGEEKSLEELNEEFRLKFLEYRDRFDIFYSFKIDVTLIPNKLRNDEFFGVYGNFKKLDVD